MPLKAIIAPSILACDFAKLGDEVKRILECGADIVHVDVMDGHFVPNISLGSPIVKSLRQSVGKDVYLDCHMMVSVPEQWVEDFANAGATRYTFHIEATNDAKALIDKIRHHNMKVGIALKPKTPIESVFPYVDLVDLVLVMTVEPGFGGQKFMQDMMPKVSALRNRYPHLDIQVDGGLDSETIKHAAPAGANDIVAGTSVFKAKDPQHAIQTMRQAVEDTINQ